MAAALLVATAIALSLLAALCLGPAPAAATPSPIAPTPSHASVDPCASAEALDSVGDREGAHAAYLKVLASEPASPCAAAGAIATRSPTSVWATLGDVARNTAKALALVVLALLALVIAVLLWLQIQTRIPWLRDQPPSARIRRPMLQVVAFDDEAIAERLGQSFSGLVRGQVSWHKDRFGVNLVSGQAGIAAALSDLGGISGETKAAVAVVSFLTALLPRRRFVLGGELQPAGAEGPGVSLELGRQQGFEALMTFWADPLGSEEDTPVRAFQSLAVASSAWVDHTMASAVGGDDLLTADPQSWAYFRCGVDAQRLGEEKRARDLYRRALVKDGTNVGALANLGIICRIHNEYDDAEQYLTKALAAAENDKLLPKLTAHLNPDWYRIRFQLAAVYLNWAADRAESDTRRPERAAKAKEHATLVARQTLETLETPPSVRRESVSPQFLKRTLAPFLEDTVEPSALVLLACVTYRDPTSHHDPISPFRPEDARTSRAQVLAAMEGGPIDPWLLVRYVELGDQLPPNARCELACFYMLTRDYATAARWLTEAIRDAPATEQGYLFEVAETDPTLGPLRKGRPGLIAKLKVRFGEASVDPDQARLASEFDFEAKVHDWLGADGWSVRWVPPDQPFTLEAGKDASALRIQLAGAGTPVTNGSVDEIVGKLTKLRTSHPEIADVRVRVMIPAGCTVASDFDYVDADLHGVDLEVAFEGSFRRLPTT